MSGEGESRRRRPNNADSNTAATTEKRTPRERIETPPIPDNFVGKTIEGRISDIGLITLRNSNRKIPAFGFINFSDNIESSADTPKIYFRKNEFSDAEFVFPRRGYYVTFTVNKGEDGRFNATGVTLTEKGKVEARAQKKEFDEKKAAKAPAAPAVTSPATNKAAEKPAAKAENPRKKQEYRVVKLVASAEGKNGDHEVSFEIGRSLGTLKKDLINHFQVADNFVISHNGTVLTSAIVKTLKDGDRIHFASPKA